MIDKKRIEEEAEHFFAWPTDDRNYVTRTSMLIFANTIAEMVRKESELAALKAQPVQPALTDERIMHLVDTHVGVPSSIYPIGRSDWINFARAIEQAVRTGGAG